MSDSMLKRPAVTPFVECPNCKRLIEYGAETCPACREEIGSDYALASAIVVVHNTQACSQANTIKTGDYAAFVSIFAALYGYASGAPGLFVSSIATPVIFLIVIGVWFYRFGRFQIGDDDYLKARRDMHASLKLWLALLSVELAALVYMLKTS
jgi:RNA polymerase subunit RPABC4/transcription elongation factor Spt4